MGFNTIMAPITECLKLGSFKWTLVAYIAYLDNKQKIIEALVLRCPDLFKVFEVAYDASSIGIRGVLSQDGSLIAYFSEKLNETK